MTDQPTDHPNDQVVDADQPATDQPTTPALVTLENAADRLGITVNAVRQRIKRGTLIGMKTADGWLVDVVATNQESGTDRPTIDLAPLTELIDDLTRRNADLAATAAMWQTRSAHLEQRLLAIEAGTPSPEAPPETVESPQANETGPHGLWDRIRRVWSGERESR